MRYLSRRILSLTPYNMLGSLIGAGIGAVGSIFGGIKASQAMKQVKNNLNEQRRRNQDWYDRRYNEDATQRADAQAILAKTEESIRNRNRQAAGAQAVMGGTEESAAATKAANAQAMADAATNIALSGERRKDMIEQQYQQKDDAIQSELNDLERGRAANTSQAAAGAVGAGMNIASLFKNERD